MSLKSSNKIEENRYELAISVDAETFEKAVAAAFRKNSKKLNVPGFRKGHAPRGIIEKMYGADVFYDEALNDLYPAEMENAQKEAGIEIVDFANIDFDLKSIGKEGAEFTVKVTVKPEAEVKDYKGIKVEKKQVSVSEDEVNAEIERMRERVSTMETVSDRPAENDDIVTFDFDGYVDGKQFEGGKAESYTLKLGSNQFIPGFEEQIVGKNPEEDFDVNVTFPEDYHAEELKGKEAVFKCKIHEIKTRVMPELDDEFVKDVSEFDTLDELKADIEKKQLEQKEKQADNEAENKILDVVIENTDVNVPKAMVDTKVEENIRDFAYTLQMQGISLEQYMQYTNLTLDALRENYADQSEKQVKLRLALEKIASIEGLEPTDDDVEAQYKEYAEMYSMDLDKIKKAIPEDELKKDLRVKKASEFVKENANVTVVADEKPVKKAAAKKPAAKKTTAKKAETDSETKPAAKKTTAKKPAAKKTTSKAKAEEKTDDK